MRCKQYELKALLIMLFLCISYTHAEWETIEIRHRQANVGNICLQGENLFIAVHGQGVYRCNVESDQWTLVREDTLCDTESRLFSYNNRLFYGNDSTYSFATDDLGKTWFSSILGLTRIITDIELVGDKLVRLNSSGVYIHSGDINSNSWSRSEQFDNGYNLFSLSKGEELVYLTGWGKVYASSDAAMTWSDISNGLPDRTKITALIELSPSLLVASTEEGIFRSGNGGESWQLFYDQFSFVNNNVVTKFIGDMSLFYGLSDSGLYLFEDSGKSVSKVSLPENWGIKIPNVCLDGTTLYVCGNTGVFRTIDKGKSWDLLQDGIRLLPYEGTLAISGESIFISNRVTTNQTVFSLSKDMGNSWNYYDTRDDSVYFPFLFGEVPFISTREDTYCVNDTIYSAGYNVLRSENWGKQWTVLVKEAPRVSFDDVLKVGSNILTLFSAYMGYKGTNLSEDNGETFKTHETGLTLSGLAEFKDDIITYSNFHRALYLSSDLGKNWTRMIPDDSIAFTSRVEVHGDIMFVKCEPLGKKEAYYYSSDGGRNWSALISDEEIVIPLEEIGIAFDSTHVVLYNKSAIEAMYRKSYEVLIGESSVVTASQNISDNQMLKISTLGKEINIGFTLTTGTPYVLSLYSVSGRELKKISGNTIDIKSSVVLNCDDYAQGAYLIRLSAGDTQLTRTVLID